MRKTKHREEILATLSHCSGALTASDIHALLPHINLVTIYRNLEAFAATGQIKKLYLGDGEARFEYQQSPHHHAVCDTCDKIVHFEISEEKLRSLLAIPYFATHSIELTVHGHCTHAHSTKPIATAK